MNKLIVSLLIFASSIAVAATAMMTIKPLIGTPSVVNTKNMQWDDTKPVINHIQLTGR